MEELLWKIGSMAVVVGFIVLIIYLNHKDSVEGKKYKPVGLYNEEGIKYVSNLTKEDIAKIDLAGWPDFVGKLEDGRLEFCDRVCCATYYL